MKDVFLLGILGIFLTGALAAQAEPLPFPDGRYVTEASLCPMSDQEMANLHGDMIGTMVRIINGNQIFDGGEMFCTVRNVNVAGENVRFRAECASEGQTDIVNGRYVGVSPTSFRLGEQIFSLCTAEANAAMSTAVAAAPATSGDRYGEEYQRCQGSTVDTMQCVNGLRDEWDNRLNAAYRQVMEAESGSQKSALRDAQRRWVAYRDANCAYYAGGQGSIARIEAAICEYALTRDRARELESMLGQ